MNHLSQLVFNVLSLKQCCNKAFPSPWEDGSAGKALVPQAWQTEF